MKTSKAVTLTPVGDGTYLLTQADARQELLSVSALVNRLREEVRALRERVPKPMDEYAQNAVCALAEVAGYLHALQACCPDPASEFGRLLARTFPQIAFEDEYQATGSLAEASPARSAVPSVSGPDRRVLRRSYKSSKHSEARKPRRKGGKPAIRKAAKLTEEAE